MMPRPIGYEKFESDVKEFLQFILRFDFIISEFPDTITLSYEEQLPFLVLTEDGQTTFSYFFLINKLEHWEYQPEVSKKFTLFKLGIEQLNIWANHGIKFPTYIKTNLKFLKLAQIHISKLDFSEYTEQNPIKNKNSDQQPQEQSFEVNTSSPPHYYIDYYKDLHISYLSESIELIEELIIPHKETEIVGIKIKQVYEFNLIALFEFLKKNYEIDDQEHFYQALTGKPMKNKFKWPQEYSTALKQLIQGLVSENCLEGKKKKKIPWITITPIFCNEDGVPYTKDLRGSSPMINFEDSTPLQGAIRRLKTI